MSPDAALLTVQTAMSTPDPFRRWLDQHHTNRSIVGIRGDDGRCPLAAFLAALIAPAGGIAWVHVDGIGLAFPGGISFTIDDPPVWVLDFVCEIDSRGPTFGRVNRNAVWAALDALPERSPVDAE